MTAAGVATVRCRSCYELHPVQGGRTPLQELAAPLQALAGHHRFYNLLDREGFKYVEEVTATPDRCLLELRNAGPKLITAVRKVIEDLRHEARGTAADVVGLDLAARVTQPALLPEITGALQALAAWAQAERGARTLGDVLTLADGITYLPPDVTRAWELMTGTGCGSWLIPLTKRTCRTWRKTCSSRSTSGAGLSSSHGRSARTAGPTAALPPSSASRPVGRASSRSRRVISSGRPWLATGTRRCAGAPCRQPHQQPELRTRCPAPHRGWAGCSPGSPSRYRRQRAARPSRFISPDEWRAEPS